MKRRSFVEFIGKGALSVPLIQLGLSGCKPKPQMNDGIERLTSDELVLTEGLEYQILLRWKQEIAPGQFFGYNNDYIAFLPENNDEGILWVNHENVHPYLVSRYDPDKIARHKKQIALEMKNVGGTIVKIAKEDGQWKMIEGDPINKRIDANTKLDFAWHEAINNDTFALGTLANCSGGLTPWGTILTCEENFEDFYGERDYITGEYKPSKLEWETFTGRPTEHYGWVVEIDPKTGEGQKHIGIGRYAHECATVKELADGRVVIYSGDDRNGGCLYKYISAESGKIFPGQLYVANTEQGKWIPITYDNPEMQKAFMSETEMYIRCREAAILAGGTPQDRPEDIEIDPISGDVFVSLTNNKPIGNYHGSILKLQEENGSYESLRFRSDTYLAGGVETGFSCPDNLAFDSVGNLWFTSDISGSSIGKGPYEKFGNNGLFVVIRNGIQAGQIIQVASAPNDAEFTGPFFDPTGETLFLSVQHPGDLSTPGNITSHWPEGGLEEPKPCVVAITGDFLKAVQAVESLA